MANGQIPLEQLVEVRPGQYLQHDTAAAFDELDAYSRDRYGIPLTISEGGAYRTLAEQTALRNEWEAGGRQGFPPAVPGFSNHGNGTAVDIWNWTHLTGSDVSRCGFARDVPGEGWHLHYLGAITPASTSIINPLQKEETMTIRIVHDGAAAYLAVPGKKMIHIKEPAALTALQATLSASPGALVKLGSLSAVQYVEKYFLAAGVGA